MILKFKNYFLVFEKELPFPQLIDFFTEKGENIFTEIKPSSQDYERKIENKNEKIKIFRVKDSQNLNYSKNENININFSDNFNLKDLQLKDLPIY